MRRGDFRIEVPPSTSDGDGDGTPTDRLTRLRARLRRLFDPRLFLIALVLSVVGVVAGGVVPVVGVLGRLLGIAVAGFALAFVARGRRYAEAGLAGAVAAGLGFVLVAVDVVFLPVLADYGVRVAGVGTAAGLIAGVVGHYLGRDLRAGLTREL